MKILVTGASGFVGRNLAKDLAAAGHAVTALSKDALNIGDESEVRRALDVVEPDVVVNAAGTKDLQGCEDDPEHAMHLNAYAPAMLARVCKAAGVKFVHIGSDHAYATPRTAYGDSKRMGDEMVMHANPGALVAVTGHVYAPGCPWLAWLDAKLRAWETVDAWGDISNWPTYAPNLAAMILDLASRNATGVHDCVGGQYVSRVELFQLYALAAGHDASLVARSAASCPSPLHPRTMWMSRPYVGKVRRMTVAEGMQAMCRKHVLEEVAA